MIWLAQCKFKFTSNGYGIVNPIKVRVYHRFWKWLLPAKVKLDWNDDDAMPFVFYDDLKDRLLWGSFDERIPDLFNKVEQIRFDYPNIKLMGRLWTKRKMIVFDKLSYVNLESKYTYLQDFIEVAEHYVEDINAYQIILPKADGKGEVYMNTLSVFIDECFLGPADQWSSGKPNSGGMRKLKLNKTI
jgi:hypothetical protein